MFNDSQAKRRLVMMKMVIMRVIRGTWMAVNVFLKSCIYVDCYFK